jgi:hypothetical protein
VDVDVLVGDNIVEDDVEDLSRKAQEGRLCSIVGHSFMVVNEW